MTAFWADLPGRALVRVSGPEAVGFLQSLLTCDLAGQAARHGGLLTPQGKILFDLLVIPRGEDSFLLDCAAGQRDELIRRLSFYRLRSKVEIAAAEMSIAAAWGEALPPGGITDPRDPGLGLRFYGNGSSAPKDPTAGDYEAHRISRGIAEAADLGSGETYPHEANYDATGGVSFTKGCYVGQEVVSRMEHRGSGGRTRIAVARFAGGLAPAAGTEIHAGDKLIGSTRSHAGTLALALVRIDRAAEALAAGESFTAAGETLTLAAPPAARFSIGGPGA